MCQLPSCNLFTQHYFVLWRDTSSDLWSPVLLFNLAIQSTSCFSVFLLQTILFPFDIINPLFSARPVRLTTSLSSWGRVIWLCCAGLHSNLGVILVSYWFDKPWFHTERNSWCCIHHHLPLGAPNIKNLWCLCRGNSPSSTLCTEKTSHIRLHRPAVT